MPVNLSIFACDINRVFRKSSCNYKALISIFKTFSSNCSLIPSSPNSSYNYIKSDNS